MAPPQRPMPRRPIAPPPRQTSRRAAHRCRIMVKSTGVKVSLPSITPDPVWDALLAWYERHGRDLPWRQTRDPYAILVSEIMLQQTQVDRVLPKYHAFLAAFPSFAELAAAPTDTVIRAWAPLGYNQR